MDNNYFWWSNNNWPYEFGQGCGAVVAVKKTSRSLDPPFPDLFSLSVMETTPAVVNFQWQKPKLVLLYSHFYNKKQPVIFNTHHYLSSGVMGVCWSRSQQSQGEDRVTPWKSSDSHLRTIWILQWPHMHAFGLWEEARRSQTWHQTHNLLAVIRRR